MRASFGEKLVVKWPISLKINQGSTPNFYSWQKGYEEQKLARVKGTRKRKGKGQEKKIGSGQQKKVQKSPLFWLTMYVHALK